MLAPLVGGAFGSKSFLWMHVVLCAVAAREVGRPVKLVLTRDQMFSSTGHRPRTVQDLVLLADDDGTGAQHRTPHLDRDLDRRAFLRTRRSVDPVPLPRHPTSRCRTAPPASTHLHRVSCAVRGRRQDCSPLRPPSTNSHTRPASIRWSLRLRNHADDDQASGKPWSGKHLLECYRKGAKRFGWDGRPLEPRALRRGGVQVGWGVATATYPGRRMPASCRVRDRCRRNRPIRLRDTRSRQRRADRHDSGGCGCHRAAAVVGSPSTPATRIFPPPPTAAPHRPPRRSARRSFAAATEWKRRLARACRRRTSDPADVDAGRARRRTQLHRRQRRRRPERPGLPVVRRPLLRGGGRRADRPGHRDEVGRGDGLRTRAQPEARRQPGDGRDHLRAGHGAARTGALRRRTPPR